MTTDFTGFGLPAKLMQALARLNYTTPTPIQCQTIPLALEGKDILGSAQTGTGKTAAFSIPVITSLMAQPQSTALILTPTRELAAQVHTACVQMMPVADIKTALLIGGEAMPRQFHQLQRNPRLVVGTPGRVIDHLTRGTLKLSNAHFLVLDETDRMLDMGFGVQIEKIIQQMPAKRQTLMFSATLPANIVKLSAKYMNEPVRVAVGSVNTPIAHIKQDTIHTSEDDKHNQLLAQLVEREGTVIVFVKSKFGTEKLAQKLNRADHRSDAIHGGLRQRQRDKVIQSFRDQKFRVLVATDVAARGLDIPHIAHVINYDLPQSPEDYIHRIGRTARAGATGEAVNLLTRADGEKWRAIEALIHGKPQTADGEKQGPRKGGRPSRRGGARFERKGEGARKRFGGEGQKSEGQKNENWAKREGGSKKFGEGQKAEGQKREGRAGKPAFKDGAKKPFWHKKGSKPGGARAAKPNAA